MMNKKSIDNYLQWVIFNDSTTKHLGEPDVIPMPEIFLPKLLERASYWSKHYPGGKVVLVFDILDTSLLTQKQIDNVNSSMQKIAEASTEFKNIVVVNFSDLKQFVLKNTFDVQELKEKNDYFKLLELRKNGLRVAFAENQSKTKSHKGTIVDLERYIVIDNFPELRKMLRMSQDEQSKPVLYTDIDIALNEIIDYESIDIPLMGRYVGYEDHGKIVNDAIENSAMFAQFTEEGKNALMHYIIGSCVKREKEEEEKGAEIYEDYLSQFNSDASYSIYYRNFSGPMKTLKTQNFSGPMNTLKIEGGLGDKVAFSWHIMTDAIAHTMGRNKDSVIAYSDKNILEMYASGLHTVKFSASERDALSDVFLRLPIPLRFSDMESPITVAKHLLATADKKPFTKLEDFIVFRGNSFKLDMEKDLKNFDSEQFESVLNFIIKNNVSIISIHDIEYLQKQGFKKSDAAYVELINFIQYRGIEKKNIAPQNAINGFKSFDALPPIMEMPNITYEDLKTLREIVDRQQKSLNFLKSEYQQDKNLQNIALERLSELSNSKNTKQ